MSLRRPYHRQVLYTGSRVRALGISLLSDCSFIKLNWNHSADRSIIRKLKRPIMIAFQCTWSSSPAIARDFETWNCTQSSQSLLGREAGIYVTNCLSMEPRQTSCLPLTHLLALDYQITCPPFVFLLFSLCPRHMSRDDVEPFPFRPNSFPSYSGLQLYFSSFRLFLPVARQSLVRS